MGLRGDGGLVLGGRKPVRRGECCAAGRSVLHRRILAVKWPEYQNAQEVESDGRHTLSWKSGGCGHRPDNCKLIPSPNTTLYYVDKTCSAPRFRSMKMWRTGLEGSDMAHEPVGTHQCW